MTAWNLEETRKHVRRLYGSDQLKLISASLNSISDRQFFAGYHYHEYKKLLKQNIDDKLAEKDLLDLTFFPAINGDQEYRTMIKKVVANIIGCLQSMHCVGDTLSHVTYYALGLNLRPEALAERSISIKSVIDLLNKLDEFSDISSELTKIISYPDFIYLEALVNHSKHRSIIEPSLDVDATDNEIKTYEVAFPVFSYNKVDYSRRKVEDFLQPFYSWLSFRTVDVGIAINNSLNP